MTIERENEEKMFSAYLQIKWANNHLVVPDDPWLSHRELQQNARRIIQLTPTANERNLAEYWMNEYQKQPDSLARLHLSAYFEESCFWVAHKLALKRAGKSSYSYYFQEYFQMARVIAAKPEKILQGYDSNRTNSLKSVKNWGQLKLMTAISEMTGEKTYSDAGLLRRQTHTSMELALQQEGISSLNKKFLLTVGVNETQLARCLLAWKTFHKVYTPTTPTGSKKLLWPNAEYLKNIADEYNQQAIQHELTPSMTDRSIDELLKTCVRALRNSSKIQISELDDFSSIPDREMISENEAGIEVLENAEIRECLSNAFTSLPKEAQIMLRLWHGLGFNQGDVGELFGIKRDQIANKVKAWRRLLLRQLIGYLGQPMTAQEIDRKSKDLDLWLKDYCEYQFVYFLCNTLNNDLNSDVQLLQNCYNKGKFDLKAGANYLEIPESEVSQRIEKLKVQLGYRLTDYVSSQLTAELDRIPYEALSPINLATTLTVDLVNQRLAEFLDENNQDIARFVEEWLIKNRAGV